MNGFNQFGINHFVLNPIRDNKRFSLTECLEFDKYFNPKVKLVLSTVWKKDPQTAFRL